MIKEKFYDIITHNKKKEKEIKNGDEFVADFVKRAGLELA